MLEAKEMALIAAKALDAKKGKDIKVLQIDKITTLADYFVICTATSSTQIKALGDAVEAALEELGEQKIHREGHRSGSWVLLDYGCVVIHLFMEEARQFYNLERLWADAEEIDLSGTAGPQGV
jgi:ribosome-associated protein